jgi:hypothetical protein
MSPDELVRLAEEEASCEVFGLLKRPDEKWVTERAYDNPKFVEDLVRDIALRLKREPRIAAWTVKSENFESIHNHSAYAEISGENGGEKPAATSPASVSAVPEPAANEPARQPADRRRRLGNLGPRHAWLLSQQHAGDPLRGGAITSAATPTPSM